jgi:DNA-binding NarL/FixJ family response regulator
MSGEERRKTRILLADGHYIVRQGIRRIFEAEPDLEVVGEADNGEQAVRLARELKPDIIVMEARIGKLDSVEVTKRVKTEHPDAAILVLSAYDDEEYVADMLRAGGGGCLLKSADGEQLVQAIRSISRGVLVVDPTVEQRILKQATRPRPVAVDFGQHLTRREAEVLKLLANGRGNRDIADYLGLAERTVKGHVMNIFDKLGVSSRTEAVREALRRGWVSLEDEEQVSDRP